MNKLTLSTFGLNVLASVVASIIFAALAYYITGTTIGSWMINTKLQISLWLLTTTHTLLFGLAVFLWLRGKGDSRRGRTNSMEQNLKLLKNRHQVHPEYGSICSTRFTHWPLTEESPTRVAFRKELSDAITVEKRQVRRIWNITNGEDIRRLREITDKYKGCQNHSIRIFWKIPILALPELLIINKQSASISLPQPRNPSQLDANQIFREAQSIEIIQGYFELLWEAAIPVFDAGVVNEIILKTAENDITARPN